MDVEYLRFAYISLTDFQRDNIKIQYDLVKYVDNSEVSKERSFENFSETQQNKYCYSASTLREWYYDFKKKEKEYEI